MCTIFFFFNLANNLCVNWAAVIADFVIVVIVSTVIMMGVVYIITGRFVQVDWRFRVA